MCEASSPVRSVLAKFPLKAAQSALETARERHANAVRSGNHQAASIFKRLVSDIESELSDRLAVIAARDVLKESGEADRQMSVLLQQMTR